MVIAKELGLHYSTVDGKEVDFLVPNKKTTGVICSKDIADEIIAALNKMSGGRKRLRLFVLKENI